MYGENETKPRTREVKLRKTGGKAPGKSTLRDREMRERDHSAQHKAEGPHPPPRYRAWRWTISLEGAINL